METRKQNRISVADGKVELYIKGNNLSKITNKEKRIVKRKIIRFQNFESQLKGRKEKGRFIVKITVETNFLLIYFMGIHGVVVQQQLKNLWKKNVPGVNMAFMLPRFSVAVM